MMFKCLDCGNLFEEGEEAVWKEPRGEFYGTTSYEELSGCPLCKGAYEETKQCVSCGSYHLEGELKDGICDECFLEFERK